MLEQKLNKQNHIYTKKRVSSQLNMKRAIISILIIVFTLPVALGQSRSRRTPKPQNVLKYQVIDGDTIYMFNMSPAIVVATRKKGKEWRKYYRLVHNFSKVYPYALIAKEILLEADSTITAGQMNNRKKNRYVSKLQEELFDVFEEPLKDLTISQGQLLLKLIQRETGIVPYEIIKTYKNKAAAGFWQGIARMFGSNMKTPYDKNGEDADTEELVQIYQKGDFNILYWSIFGKEPPEPHSRPKNDFPQY